MRIGYALSCEEHGPERLVAFARLAEERGFEFALISDHFHPWTDRQGESPFVWSVLGAIAQATERLEVGTGVTCPTMRIHPALVAQAAATVAALMPGRFFLGVGTGENLNEHVTGHEWPDGSLRLAMLEEALDVIRELWTGELVTRRGEHFTVSQARIYTLPDEPPPILVAAAKPEAAKVAGANDGLISTAPDPDLLQEFEEAGGTGKRRIGQITVCWAEDEAEARRTALEWWPNAAMGGNLGQELPIPADFEAVAELVSEDDVAEKVACGPDPGPHLELLGKYRDAGYEEVYVHQVGPNQEGFMDFYAREVIGRV